MQIVRITGIRVNLLTAPNDKILAVVGNLTGRSVEANSVEVPIVWRGAKSHDVQNKCARYLASLLVGSVKVGEERDRRADRLIRFGGLDLSIDLREDGILDVEEVFSALTRPGNSMLSVLDQLSGFCVVNIIEQL